MKQTIKHGVPALMSFFISGLGQLIKGDTDKFFQIWLMKIAALIPTFLFFVSTGYFQTFFFFVAILGWFALIPIWVWNVYDAYNN